jgi:hypothetical protein
MVRTMVDLMLQEEIERLLLVDFELVQQLDHRDVDREIVDWLERKKTKDFLFSSLYHLRMNKKQEKGLV